MLLKVITFSILRTGLNPKILFSVLVMKFVSILVILLLSLLKVLIIVVLLITLTKLTQFIY